MVRAPCCEKTGLKKGPWTPEEDNILISYIQHHGHPNWRSLPKQAGLLRCGKSCRLRWTNYLRPDIKRGNFTVEEERTIIHLHQTLGNRWSVIASRLPGRTDNEIKNVWHTHLKKKLNNYTKPVSSHEVQSDLTTVETKSSSSSSSAHQVSSATPIDTNHINNINAAATESIILDPEQMGDVVTTTFPEIDESFFWSEDFMSTSDNFMAQSQFRDTFNDHDHEDLQFYFSTPALMSTHDHDHYGLNLAEEGMDFWYNNIFIKAGKTPQL